MRFRLTKTKLTLLVLVTTGIVFVLQNYNVTILYPKNIILEGGVSLAADGNTIVLGRPKAYYESGNGTAEIYSRSDSTWIWQDRLQSSDARLNPRNLGFFGELVSISGDTIVVGSPRTNFKPKQTLAEGVAYIFTRQGSTWVEQTKLIPPNPNPGTDTLRRALIDGNTVALSTEKGNIYIFERDSKTSDWSYRQNLTLSATEGRLTAAMVMHGNTIVVLGIQPVTQAPDKLRLYLYQREGDTKGWVFQGRIDPNSFFGTYGCGSSMAMDENTLVVGCSGEGLRLPILSTGSIGGAYVFERHTRTGVWRQTAWLQPKGANTGGVLWNYGFGAGVAVRGDILLVSAHNGGQWSASKETATYLYRRDSKTGWWNQKAKILAVPPERLPQQWFPSGRRIAITKSDVILLEAIPLEKPPYVSGSFYSFDLKELRLLQ